MLRSRWPVLGMLLSVAILYPLPAEADGEDGKTVFIGACSTCHGVASAGVPRTGTAPNEQGPDLSNLSGEVTARVLINTVTVKHKSKKKKFSGTDEELQVLVDWLLEQKDEDADE